MMTEASPSALVVRGYPAGQDIFQEGDAGSEMYVIRQGKVRITKSYRDVPILLSILGPGDFFGEIALLCGRPRSATAQVTEDATLIVLDSQTLRVMIQDNQEITIRMLRKLAGRLADADRRIQLLISREASARVAAHLLWEMEVRGLERGRLLVTPQEISAQTDCTLGEVLEALGHLDRMGLILQTAFGAISVPDRDGLAGFFDLP
jgi:CRP-like cAMP-binding protein